MAEDITQRIQTVVDAVVTPGFKMAKVEIAKLQKEIDDFVKKGRAGKVAQIELGVSAADSKKVISSIVETEKAVNNAALSGAALRSTLMKTFGPETGKQIYTANNALNDFGKKMDFVEGVTGKTKTQLLSAVPALQKMQSSIRTLSAAQDELNTRQSYYLGFIVGNLGRQMQFLALGIGAALGASVKAFGDFQAELKFTQAVGDLNEHQIASLSKEYMNLSETSSFTATQIAKAGSAGIKAGVSFNDLKTILPEVTEYAAVFSREGVNVETAIDGVIRVLNQFNMPISEAGRVMNVIAAGAAETTAQITSLQQGLANVGPIAKNLNISLERTVAVLALADQVGIKASKSGTQFRMILQQLAKLSPENITKRAAESLSRLGTNQEEVNVITNDFIKILRDFKGEEISAVEATNLMRDRSAALFLSLVSNVEALDDLEKKITGTNIVGEGFAIISEGINFQMAEMRNNILNTAIEIGKSLLPGVLKMMEYLSGFMELIKDTGTGWIAFGAVTSAAILLILGSILRLRGLAISSLLDISQILRLAGKEVVTFGGLIDTITIKWLYMKDAILASSAALGGWAVAASLGIGISIGALIVLVPKLYTKYKEIRDILNETDEVYKKMAGDAAISYKDAVKYLTSIGDKTKEGITLALKGLEAERVALLQLAKTRQQDIDDRIDISDEYREKLQEEIEVLKAQAAQLQRSINVWKGVRTEIKDTADAVEELSEVYDSYLTKQNDFLYGEFLPALKSVRRAFEDLVETDDVKKQILDLQRGLEDFTADIGELIFKLQLFPALYAQNITGIMDMFNSYKTMTGKMIDDLNKYGMTEAEWNEKIKKNSDDAKDALLKDQEEIQRAFEQTADRINDFMTDAFVGLIDGSQTIKDIWKSLLNNMLTMAISSLFKPFSYGLAQMWMGGTGTVPMGSAGSAGLFSGLGTMLLGSGLSPMDSSISYPNGTGSYITESYSGAATGISSLGNLFSAGEYTTPMTLSPFVGTGSSTAITQAGSYLKAGTMGAVTGASLGYASTQSTAGTIAGAIGGTIGGILGGPIGAAIGSMVSNFFPGKSSYSTYSDPGMYEDTLMPYQELGTFPQEEPYPLPESAYFSGRWNGRGQVDNSITINIDNAVGDATVIAQQVAEKVQEVVTSDYNKALYQRGLQIAYP